MLRLAEATVKHARANGTTWLVGADLRVYTAVLAAVFNEVRRCPHNEDPSGNVVLCMHANVVGAYTCVNGDDGPNLIQRLAIGLHVCLESFAKKNASVHAWPR